MPDALVTYGDGNRDANQFVVGVPWPTFQAWFADVWQPGQHVAMIGPTGQGKTTMAVGILNTRKYVLSLDAKGGDSTLAKAGFTRVNDWPPPREVLEAIADGRPARLSLGFELQTVEDFVKLKTLMSKVLDASYAEKGWTLHLDELQVLADRKMMNLGARIEKHLVSARDKKISVVSLYQAPAWVPTAASRQATWVILWPTRDEDVIKKVAAISGRPWRELLAAIKMLPKYHVLVAGLDPFEPLVLTTPPRV